jgi:transposase-like protein
MKTEINCPLCNGRSAWFTGGTEYKYGLEIHTGRYACQECCQVFTIQYVTKQEKKETCKDEERCEFKFVHGFCPEGCLVCSKNDKEYEEWSKKI